MCRRFGSSWRPPTLLDVVSLNNYYTQRIMERALALNLRLPNTLYLGSLSGRGDGCLLVGTEPALGAQRYYAFSATMLLATVNWACSNATSSHRQGALFAGECDSAKRDLAALRAMNPFSQWQDPGHGRISDWPPFDS